MTAAAPKPTWLARETGIAHAFLHSWRNGIGLELRSVCKHVDRSLGLPFAEATDDRQRCVSCVLRLRQAAQLAARKAKEGA